MLRKILASVSILLLAFGLTSAVGAAASAHTGDLNASAVCQPDGTYLVTYKLTTANTNLNGSTMWRVGTTSFQSTPTSASGMDRGPVLSSGSQTITLGTISLPGNSTKAPWAYAWTTWSDNFAKGSDGGDISLDGKCAPPKDKHVPTNPTIVDPCGTANDTVTLPANTANITYTTSNGYVIATLSGSNVEWGTPPSGWTASNGKLKYKLPAFDTTPCKVVDVCPNLTGDQAEVPAGWTKAAGKCFHIEVVCWEMVNYHGDRAPVAGAQSTFPQERIDCEKEIPCGVWVQKDTYKIDSSYKEAIWQGLGDELEWKNGKPEDSKIYVKHVFLKGKDCPPPPKVKVCEYIDGHAVAVEYAENALPQNYIPWVNGDECTPTIDVCKWVDGEATQVTVLVTQQGDDPTWVNGDECTPEKTQICVWNAETKIAIQTTIFVSQLRDIDIPWRDGSECTPPLDIDLSSIQPICDSGVPYLGVDVELNDPGNQSTDDGTVDLKFWDDQGHVYWMNNVVLDDELKAEVLWPGAELTDGVASGWPGWAFEDGAWVSVGDENFGWTREGAQLTIYFNPEKTLPLVYPPAEWECGDPPPVEVCEYTLGDASGHAVEYAAGEVPEGAIPFVDGSECVDVCPNLDALQSVVPSDRLVYGKGLEAKCLRAPTLEGTLFASQCIDDVPWIVYDVNVVDLDGTSEDDGTATFTFRAEGSDEEYVKTVAIGNGQFLWPGASAIDNGDDTYTATGWPGWALIDDEWVSVGDDNYGWTRDGVTVTIEVNPTMTVTLAYPPPTELCVAGPPTEEHGELDAPPADAVEAEAQYAG